MKIFLWCLVAVIASVELYWACKFTEYVYCAFFRRQPPNEPSVHIHHVAVVWALRAYYPNARRICEIGCGSGGMVRYIARRVRAQVTGIENMPLSVLMARMRNLFPDLRATHVIDLKGFVLFNGRKYPHRLYVYEF